MALDGWKEKLFRRYLYWLCRPTRLRRRVASLIDEGGPVPVSVPLVDGSRLRVAALQVKVKLSRDPLHYAAEVHRRVRQASSEGAQLVVFPEYNNLPLLGMLPGVEEMSKNVSDEGAGGERDGRREGSPATDVTVADVIHYIGPVVSPFLDALYIARSGLPPSPDGWQFFLADGDRVVNASLRPRRKTDRTRRQGPSHAGSRWTGASPGKYPLFELASAGSPLRYV